MRRTVAALSLLVALGLAPAALGDVLELRSGQLLAGKVESLDDAGLTFVPENGGSVTVTWEKVVDRCRYELTRTSLAADDAAGRVKLAKWCLEAGLHRAA